MEDPKEPVSYTHLDVYKRQKLNGTKLYCFMFFSYLPYLPSYISANKSDVDLVHIFTQCYYVACHTYICLYVPAIILQVIK